MCIRDRCSSRERGLSRHLRLYGNLQIGYTVIEFGIDAVVESGMLTLSVRDFAQRNYSVCCFDLSGGLACGFRRVESFSFDSMGVVPGQLGRERRGLMSAVRFRRCSRHVRS